MSDTRIFTKTTLGFALAVQVVLVGALLAARSGAVSEPAPFLSFDAAEVDALSISNDEGAVELVKDGETWQLPGGLPADAAKVDRVVERFGNADGGWPVASKASTAERFEVADETHQRRVVLKSGDDELADFYLGTSPGYRKAHARHADDSDIYAITFSNYEAGVKASDWLDKSLLRPDGALTAVERMDGFALTKGEEGVWTAADGTVLDQGKTETFAGRFTGLSVIGISDAELPEAPKMVFALRDDLGTANLAIYHLADDDDYVAVSDRLSGAFEMSSYIAEQMDKAVDDLAPDPPEDVETDASDDESLPDEAAALEAVETEPGQVELP